MIFYLDVKNTLKASPVTRILNNTVYDFYQYIDKHRLTDNKILKIKISGYTTLCRKQICEKKSGLYEIW
jgi:hypothetical protein